MPPFSIRRLTVEIQDLINLVAQESGAAVVAALALHMLRQSYRQRIEDREEQIAELNRYAELFQKTLVDIAHTLGQNNEVHRRLIDLLERQANGE
jgi:hypothetical protein